MSKGEQTRERILARSAQLFNRQGYFGASLADIMRETGLEKGGIYNHFSSKEQLALESFDYAYGLVQQRVRQALAGKLNAIERQEIRPGINADEVASIFIVTLEGAIMLSNLYKDPRHMKCASDHIVHYIETLRPPDEARER